MDATAGADATLATTADTMLAPAGVDPRRWHYREFYELADAPDSFGMVLGNCQAESLRIVLGDVAGPTVRMPPVHELEPDDLPFFERLLPRAGFIVAQPIRDDYRGMPLGTAQVRARVRAQCRVVTWPSIRFAGLYPFQTAMHAPGVTEDPPIVAYHDVRTIAAAAGEDLPESLTPAQVRLIATDSIDELRRREEANEVTVAISDQFVHPIFDMMRTVNHAGNPVWKELAARVLEALGAPAEPVDPQRPLLAAVEAPREPWVAEAWDIDGARRQWRVGGQDVDPDDVRAAQSAWYAANPAFVAHALDRLAGTMARWRAV